MPQEGLVQRPAEGSRTGPLGRGRNAEVMEARNKGGRPKGSKNKSKSLIPTELADKILVTMEGNLPSEHLDYMRDVVKRGGAVSTKRELDVLILLLNRNLWPALVSENKDDESEPVFRKDVTERLKVLNSLLALQIFGKRDIASRIGILVDSRTDSVSGNADGTGRSTIQTGTISDQADERPLALSAGEQESPDRILDGDSG